MALGAFDQIMDFEKGNLWPESYKEASRNVCDTFDNARRILEQVCGKDNFKAEDIILVCQMILNENERLETLKEKE